MVAAPPLDTRKETKKGIFDTLHVFYIRISLNLIIAFYGYFNRITELLAFRIKINLFCCCYYCSSAVIPLNCIVSINKRDDLFYNIQLPTTFVHQSTVSENQTVQYKEYSFYLILYSEHRMKLHSVFEHT